MSAEDPLCPRPSLSRWPEAVFVLIGAASLALGAWAAFRHATLPPTAPVAAVIIVLIDIICAWCFWQLRRVSRRLEHLPRTRHQWRIDYDSAGYDIEFCINCGQERARVMEPDTPLTVTPLTARFQRDYAAASESAGDGRCPDGGRCHHRCREHDRACFRVLTCSPLTGVYTYDAWPDAIVVAERDKDKRNRDQT